MSVVKLTFKLKFLLAFVVMFSVNYSLAGSPQVTYQGRILTAAGAPVTQSVQFKLQIRSPGSEDCLMYEEVQAQDLTTTNGMFSLALNSSLSTRTDGGSYAFSQIFSNKGTFNLGAGKCATGTTFVSSALDNRNLKVFFNDGSGWESLPVQSINHVPMAMEATQVGGFNASALLRVEDSGVLGNVAPLTTNYFNELISLITGVSTQYTKASSNGTVVIPQTTTPSHLSTGQMWYESGLLKYYNGTATVTLNSSGGAVSISQLPVGTSSSTVAAGNDSRIVNAIQNAGFANSIKVGADAALPAGHSVGRFYVASDTQKIYYDNGTVWIVVGAGNAISTVDLGSSDVSGTLGVAHTPAYIGDVTKSAASNTLVLSNSGVTAGTYAKVTVDAKGRVVSSTSLTFGDITTALSYAPASATLVDTLSTSYTALAVSMSSMTSSQWTTTGSDIYRASGRVGIGAISPSAKLHITAGTASSAPFKFTSGTLLTAPASGAVEYDGFNLYYTDGTNTRRTVASIDSTGTQNNTSVISNSSNITLAPTGSVVVSSTTASTSSNTGALVVNGGMGISGNLYSSGSIVTSSNIQGSSITATSGVSTTVITGVPYLALNPNGGNVGIGTATPTGILDVQGGTAAAGVTGLRVNIVAQNAGAGGAVGGGITLRAGSGTNSWPNGQITLDQGSGTKAVNISRSYNDNYATSSTSVTLPNTSLEIVNGNSANGNSSLISFITSNSTPKFNRAYLGIISAQNGTNDYGGAFVIGQQTGNAAYNERLRIDSVGNIGIGTSSPVAALDVAAGNVAINGNYISNDGDPEGIKVDTAGRVTITNLSGSMSTGLTVENTSSSNGSGIGISWKHSTVVGAQIVSTVSGTTANDNLSFYTRGSNALTERMRLTADGYLGIGTASPTGVLDVRGGSAAANTGGASISLKAQDATGPAGAVGGQINLTPGLGAGSWSGGSVRVFATNGQYSGLSITNDATNVYVVSSTTLSQPTGVLQLNNSWSGTNNTALVLSTARNNSSIVQRGYYGFVSNAGATTYSPDFIIGNQTDLSAYQERIRVQGATGYVGIGTASPTTTLDVAGSINIVSGSALTFGGTNICTSSGCNSTSDLRLKENIRQLDFSLEKILKLRAVQYDWKDKAVYGKKHRIGFIAQELEKIYPEVVDTDENTGIKTVSYGHLLAPVVDAIAIIYRKVLSLERDNIEMQKLQQKLGERESDLNRLKDENKQMKSYLCLKDPRALFCKN